jgi:hypothetical protein
MNGIIGKKLGMTSIYNGDGKRVACTVIEAGPCVVTQVKTHATDGYNAVQIAFGDKKDKHTTAAEKGHFAKANTTGKKEVVEFRDAEAATIGTVLDVSLFEEGEYLLKLKKPNGLLIIDEAHRLVSSTGTSYRKLLFALKYHAHPKFRTVLLTGSPIYDKPYEFGLLINLLRPRIPFPDGPENFNEIFLTSDSTMKNVNLFKQMCNVYVSYFKGGNPEAYPYKKTIIMNHSMSPYQYSAYKRMLLKEIKRTGPIIKNRYI